MHAKHGWLAGWLKSIFLSLSLFAAAVATAAAAAVVSFCSLSSCFSPFLLHGFPAGAEASAAIYLLIRPEWRSLACLAQLSSCG